jgi:mRNA interferase RelE/StbE
MVTVTITPEALEQVAKLPLAIQARIQKLMKRLAAWPDASGVKALSGNLAGWCRLRTGDYRVRFRGTRNAVVVDKIGHRRDFYED